MIPEIPKDSIILVTGCNGFVASHIVDQLLILGYRVRGATRDLANIEVTNTQWETSHGKGRFKAVLVPNMAEEGAFDQHLNGISGIIHVASNVSITPSPEIVIPENISGCLNLLKGAQKRPEIRSFVYTSSSTAASLIVPNVKFHIDSTTWNETSIQEALGDHPTGFHVYAASKALSEKAIWKFFEDEKLSFRVNTILPDTVLGQILDKSKEPTHTGRFALKLLRGERLDIPLQWFIDVQDTALLHIAALLDPEVNHERILGFAQPFNWNDVLDILRKLRPENKVVENYMPDTPRDISTVANERALELLKSMGRTGWTSLEESVGNNIEGW